MDIPPPAELPTDLDVPAGRERLGRAHQLRVDISIVISMTPAWLKRALVDRSAERARGARIDLVERIACALERRFRITWHGSNDPVGERPRRRHQRTPIWRP